MSVQRKRSILVVDDQQAVVEFLCESLDAAGYSAYGMISPVEALDELQAKPYDLVLTDVEMPQMRGTIFLQRILELRPTQLVLLMTAFGSVESAVAAVRDGACDFLTKPFQIEALVHAIERAFESRMLRREVVRLRAALAQEEEPNLVAKSQAMEKALALARRVARSSAPVFLTGETGSGKSVLARRIHEMSLLAQGPFVEINCATIPNNLAEAELFGAKRGAFTDAKEDRQGVFEAAHGGSLFLDEIGELPLEVQAKLLRVLETNQVRPLGSSHEIPVNVRLLAATNRVPELMLEEGSLRADLYYRIHVVRIEVPPLRERPEDILPLIDQLLHKANKAAERPVVGISVPALKLLAKYSWPGNIRELANVIERAVAFAEHDVILPEDLDFLKGNNQPPQSLQTAAQQNMPLSEMELQYIKQVFDLHGGNKAATAKALGITRRTLYRKLFPNSQ